MILDRSFALVLLIAFILVYVGSFLLPLMMARWTAWAHDDMMRMMPEYVRDLVYDPGYTHLLRGWDDHGHDPGKPWILWIAYGEMYFCADEAEVFAVLERESRLHDSSDALESPSPQEKES